MRLLISLVCSLSCAAMLHAQTAAMDAAACERLAASLGLPNAKVTLAQPVTSHRFVPPATPGASAPPVPHRSAGVLPRHLDADSVN